MKKNDIKSIVIRVYGDKVKAGSPHNRYGLGRGVGGQKRKSLLSRRKKASIHPEQGRNHVFGP